ncbi:MAG: dihydroxyacetone kinase subunit L [Succinatimonas sp.]|nr:dihydroxyacetone kinase subunit L [Succinatimonas sp.]
MEFTINSLKEVMKACSALMEENKQYLIDLDSALGDGDLGLTMTAGFAEGLSFITTTSESDLGKATMQMGLAISKKVPSTMGTLVASGFMGAGKTAKGKNVLNSQDFALFLEGFVQGVMNRGKANPGDRTIVDSIYPATEAVKQAIVSGADIATAIKSGYEAALQGVEATKNMKPKFGRAVYYGDQVLGKEDQGAVVGRLIFEGFSKALA